MLQSEIPGPTKKVQPPKHSGSDTNEISGRNNKNQANGGKDSHLQTAKNSYQNPEYDDDYDIVEGEDFEMGKIKL